MNLLPFTRAELTSLDRKSIWVMMASVGCLVAIRFLSNPRHIPFLEQLFHGNHYFFWSTAYWAVITIFFYLVVPAVVIKVVFNERLRDYGLKRSTFFGYLPIYALALGGIFPVVWLASYSPAFQVTYPFYVPTDRADIFPYFFVWEALYVMQFFALEFFFRGFMVQGLKTKLGMYSVFVMTIPYCMIHFNKPLPECVGSIVAGLFLGLMSYKTGSVWMGALLHVAVAISMDVLSLWHRGYF